MTRISVKVYSGMILFLIIFIVINSSCTVSSNNNSSLLVSSSKFISSSSKSLITGGDTSLKLKLKLKMTASASNLKLKLKAEKIFQTLLKENSCFKVGPQPPQGQINVTPDEYKLSLVNFWLINISNQDISILNQDTNAPIYTENNPLIMNSTSNNQLLELINNTNTNMTAGTYKGYKMQFLYIQMRLPVIFHVPDPLAETQVSNVAEYLEKTNTLNFRLYFNAINKYWKRDFVVEIPEGSDNWYWMRRSQGGDVSRKNFFIAVNSNVHPAGGPGFESTIDLFADEFFWGPNEAMTNSNPIIVGTHTNAGGVNAFLPVPFTIPDGFSNTFRINLGCDITNTMNFQDRTDTYPGVAFNTNYLDLGPAVFDSTGTNNAPPMLTDQGFHPFMPKFSVTTFEE